jgi:DNA-binding NarL/FixJ family response regulator
MIRVLVADDHPLFLDGLRLLLDSTPGIEVAGSAADGPALLDLARTTAYDVAVVDLDMPSLDGASATRELVAMRPDARVLVLTMHDDTESVHRALRAGARGYLLKGAAQGAIVRAIHAVADGETVLAGGVSGAVLRAATASTPHASFPTLTAREVAVLELVARGLTNPDIARELFLSVKTVQNRVSDLLAKTGCSTRAQLVAHARDASAGD